jgi:RNA polymerase sigma factor (sigma-70 family)
MGMRLATAALKLQSDERLVKLARQAHEPAFEAIVERYRGPLERYAARMADPCRAEDLVQHAFTRLYLFLCEDERELVLGPWLYRVTRNAAINAGRERCHEQFSENYDGVPQPPQVAEQRAHLRLVIGGLAELPERQRVAMVRRELEGRSYDEVAEELGVSGVGARQLVSRARIRLRDAVGLLIPFPLLRLGDVSAAGGAGAAAGGAGAAGGGTLTLAAAAGGGSAAQTIGAVVAVTAAVGASGAAVAPRTDTHRRAPEKAPVTRAAPVKPTVSQVIRRPALAAEAAPVVPAVVPPSESVVPPPADGEAVDAPATDFPSEDVEPIDADYTGDGGALAPPPDEADSPTEPVEPVVEESSPDGSTVLAPAPGASTGPQHPAPDR